MRLLVLLPALNLKLILAQCAECLDEGGSQTGIGDQRNVVVDGTTTDSVGENYHDLDVYGGGLNANVAWALGKTAVGFDISKECIYSTALGEELAEKDYKDISGSDRQYTRKGERTNTNIMLESIKICMISVK